MNLSKFYVFLAVCGLGLQTASAQIPKIKKPKVSDAGKLLDKGSKSDSKSASKAVKGKQSDPSGLFDNISEDPSASAHRKAAVSNLAELEAEFAKTSVDYNNLSKLLKDTEQRLGFVKKLEPEADAAKFQEKYAPLKAKGDEQMAIYDKVQSIEKELDKEFSAPTQYKAHDLYNFRVAGYGQSEVCYCRSHKTKTKTFAEYQTNKANYEAETAKLIGYQSESTQRIFKNMETCLQNGNQYAIWAAGENLKKDVLEYETKKYTNEPKELIKRCEAYLAGLERIETDYSLNLSDEAKKALSQGKTQVQDVKTKAENYISSGEYQKHLDKLHKEKIAKVFLPKAESKNASLEQGAVAYLKGQEYSDYVGDEQKVTQTFKTVMVTKEPKVVKNEYDLPKYQFHEFWVSFKGKDGKCYRAAVYASYTYKGGGTYAQTPTWGADRPEEMACENVNK